MYKKKPLGVIPVFSLQQSMPLRSLVRKMTCHVPSERISAAGVVEDLREKLHNTATIVWDLHAVELQLPRYMKLEVDDTVETELQSWSSFTVTESGIIVVYGRPSHHVPDSFHQYKKTSAGWSKLGELNRMCEHEDSMALLSLTINGKEVLVVGCGDCRVIKLLDVENGKVTIAFQNQNFCPLALCEGGGDTLFLMHENGNSVMVSELSTNQIPFALTKKEIPSGMTIASGMLYIPHPDNLLVFSSHLGLIKAVSAETGEKVWEVEGTVDEEECCPRDLIFHPQYQVLLVADSTNSRVLVLHPRDGSHLQTIHLDREILSIVDFCLHRNKLTTCCYYEDKKELSNFIMN